jgi:hypothetical protein
MSQTSEKASLCHSPRALLRIVLYDTWKAYESSGSSKQLRHNDAKKLHPAASLLKVNTVGFANEPTLIKCFLQKKVYR